MYFKSENFTFNGVSNMDKSVILVTFDDDLFKSRGTMLSNEIQTEKTIGGYVSYTVEEKETENITLNLMLVNEDGSQREWDIYSYQEVRDWLCTKDFAPFISEDNEDLIYYLKVINIEKKITLSETGYLEVVFKPLSIYPVQKVVKKCSNGEVIINNLSNVEEFNFPIFKTSSNISIKNKTLDESRVFTLDTDKPTTVDNLMCTVLSDSGENLFSNCNRKWIKLKQGKNVLEVVGDVTIICNFPVSK